MALTVEQIFRLWNFENIAEIQKQMIQQDANATGKTSASLRTEQSEFGGQLLGSRAFNIPLGDTTGRASIEIGSPPGTLVPIKDLQEWADARRYRGNVRRLQTRIFERGTLTVNKDNPRNIYTPVLTDARLQELYTRLNQPLRTSASSEIVKAFRK